MAQVTIEPRGADNVKVMVRMAMENKLKVLMTGIAALHTSLYLSSK